MSSELTSSAEAKFFALMELMSSASREASSLKDIWLRLLAERQSWAEEREEIMEEITEVREELERKKLELVRAGTGHDDRKKQIEKLKLDLSLSVAGVLAEKKKVAERDHLLGVARRELLESRESISRTHIELERVRSEYDALIITLRTVEGDRDASRDEADTLRREVSKVTRERTEISSRIADITAKYEAAHREVLSATDKIKMYEAERDEHLHEVDRLREEIRKAKMRVEESVKENLEVTERADRLARELSKLKETTRLVEVERDDLTHTVEHLRRDNKTTLATLSETEDRYSELNLKHEHIKREVLATKDKLREVEIERNDTLEHIDRSREQYRLIVIERDELKDSINISERKAHDANRRILTLEDSIRRTESLLVEARTEITNLGERLKRVIIERDDVRSAHDILITEVTDLKAKIVMFQADVRTITESRDQLRGQLERSRADLEEVTETYTSYEDGSAQLEFEIESLRTLLRESREQKERAIAARNIADRERDEANSKYEEKCRELERFEESVHMHAHSSSSGAQRSASTRVVSSRSTGTTIHNGSN